MTVEQFTKRNSMMIKPEPPLRKAKEKDVDASEDDVKNALDRLIEKIDKSRKEHKVRPSKVVK